MFPSADQVLQSVVQIVTRVWGLAVFLLGLDEDWNVLSVAENIFPHCASASLEQDCDLSQTKVAVGIAL